MRNNNRCCYAFVEGLGRELITVPKRQCAVYSCKFTTRKADQDTNNTYTLLVYLGMFSWLYTLLVSWYVFLVVHFVSILVCFPGCIPFVGSGYPGCRQTEEAVVMRGLQP